MKFIQHNLDEKAISFDSILNRFLLAQQQIDVFIDEHEL